VTRTTENGTAPLAQTAQLIGFRRHLRAEVVPGEAAYLFSERGVTALFGPHVEALTPLLDGTRDLPALLKDLPDGLTAEQVGNLLTRLMDAGLVGPRTQTLADADETALAYWDTSGLNPSSAVTDIARSRLALLAVGDLGAAATSAAAAALDSAGLSVTADPATADLSVVLCTDYLSPELAEIDAAHRAAGRPWLLAKPVGATVWIGPIFQPHEACWHCLTVRLRAHRRAEGYVQAALGRSGPARVRAVTVPPLTTTAMHMVALEAVKWLAGYRYQGQHSVWTMDSFDLRGRHHELRARPQCLACGDPTLMRAAARRPVRLQPRRKACYTGGGHRSRPPEQVLADYRHLISPITGVIKEIGRDPRGPAFFNAFRSGPNNAAAGARSLRGLKSALRIENGGKGITALHAEVSALCEALERHSGTFDGDEERVRGSLRSLGEVAIHPNTCQLYDERQYADREACNAAHSPFQFVCTPFDERAVLDWSPVWSVTEQRHRLLPTTMLYFGAPGVPGETYARADSNGNAAGTSIEDAVLQGLLELVERDSVALWWYNRTRAPGVDLDAFADAWIDELREVYAGLHREVWVLDLTADLGVPTMAALSRRTGSAREAIVFGFGAHPDPAVALRRALTELNQLMPALVQAGPGGEFNCDDDPDAAHWFRHATVANQPYLLPDPTVWPRRPADYRYEPSTDLAADVRAIQTRLAARGMQLLVLDQTRPDIGLPVVKVIVPGLRHFWARFGPGRLYDVPVELGRLPAPTPYHELNPLPLFV
jgi:ribosomal protein S12 methylthiotransferase accessory factor